MIDGVKGLGSPGKRAQGRGSRLRLLVALAVLLCWGAGCGSELDREMSEAEGRSEGHVVAERWREVALWQAWFVAERHGEETLGGPLVSTRHFDDIARAGVRLGKARRDEAGRLVWEGETDAAEVEIDHRQEWRATARAEGERAESSSAAAAGRGRAAAYARLRLDLSRGVYDVTFDPNPIEVQITGEGAAGEDGSRQERLPRVRSEEYVLPAEPVLLEGESWSEDGVLLRWRLRPLAG